MHLTTLLTGLTAIASLSVPITASPSHHDRNPHLFVPSCPRKTTATYTKSVPDKTPFPKTAVDLCYDKTSLHLTFKAYDEKYFYFDPEQGTNGDIWEYEVMEAFLYHGDNDPSTYFEFEINPNNVTYQAFVYNPSKVRADDAPFDHAFISNPAADGFSASTVLDKEEGTWFSDVVIPLALFNVDRPRGSRWRMNFLRTVTSPEMFPDQELGAWSPPDEANFHITSKFGDVFFV